MPTSNGLTVAGIFAEQRAAEQAVEALRAAGFPADTIDTAGQEAASPAAIVAVQAGRRFQEAASILRRCAAPTETGDWADVAAGYRFGHETAADRRWQERCWQESEPELRQCWQQQHDGDWQRVRESVRDAWQAAGRC